MKQARKRGEIGSAQTYRCPETGLPILCKPEWTDIDLGKGYSVTFKFIGDRILLSIPRGNAGAHGMENLFRERAKVLKAMLGPDDPFFEMKDYSEIQRRLTRAGRDQFAKGMKVDKERIMGFIGYNAPLSVKLAISVGSRLHKAPFPMSIVKDYKTAIKRAAKATKTPLHIQQGRDNGKRAPIDPDELQQYIDDLLYFLGSINWATDGLDDRGQVDPSHPFSSIFDAIALIKTDMDDLSRERERTLKALRKSELRYRYLVENANDIIYRTDANGNFTFFNPVAIRYTGYSEKDLIGKNYLDLIHPDYRKEEERFYGIQFVKKIPSTNHEILIVRKDGKEVWLEQQVQLIMEDNEVVGFHSIARDITERKCAEDALKESEEKYRTILESIQDAYFEVDLAGNFTFFNDSMCRILGYSRDELIGVNNRDYMDETNAKTVYQTFNRVYKTGNPDEGFGWEFTRKDGSKRYVESSVSLIRDSKGKAIGFRGILRDISERKRTEEALRKAKTEAETANTAKSIFLANMSHEIRTPMNAVIGFADLLLDTSLNEDQSDYTRTIKRSAEALLSLLNDILDFSKIEAGELDFEEIDFDPELLAYDVCDLIRPRIGDKPIEILCRIGDNLPANLKGDPFRLRQVLTNLMGNAIKFTESGEIELSLDVEEEKDDRVKLHGKIRDTGIGIRKEKLNIIFEAFQQADGSVTRTFGGTGLGLAICKQISNLVNGDVWAESEVGKGSIFHLTAWVKRAEDKGVKRFTPVSLSGLHVLIVDDNQTNLDILRCTLERAGMRVVALVKSEEVVPALKKAMEATDPFDLCITDIQMPHMSGLDVANEIRDSKHNFNDIRLIAVSSSITRDAKKCKQAGFDGFLSKPIHSEKLFRMLERIIGEKEEKGEVNEAERESIMTQYTVREEIKHSVRILLAEDNPVNQKLAKMMLGKAGYQIEVANDGKEAVEKYTASPEDFDLIFMDVQMPEMDGMEATEAIRNWERSLVTAQSPSAKEKTRSCSITTHVPIIAMTARAMKGDKETCIEAGMDDYISKPIKRETVFDILEKWVFKKRGL